MPCSDHLYADFYLPALPLYIDYWSEAHSSADIAGQMKKKAFYEQSGAMVIHLEPEDMSQLDEVLTREFRKRGIRIY